MALRSFFALVPGLVRPDQFRIETAQRSELLTQQDLWSAAANYPPALIFRVRSESDPGVTFSDGDRLESCVGLLDAVARWRGVFNMTRTAISAVRHPILAKACLDVMTFVSSNHPANITPMQRQAFVDAISKAAEEQMGDTKVTPFEANVAMGVVRLAQADNDVEAAHLVPFLQAFCPFERETPAFNERLATIETMAGAVFLTETANRLSERIPQWHFAEMPAAAGGGQGDEE